VYLGRNLRSASLEFRFRNPSVYHLHVFNRERLDELEDPFGNQPNALAISALADTIEINLLEAMGEKHLPPLPSPKDFILM